MHNHTVLISVAFFFFFGNIYWAAGDLSSGMWNRIL